MASYSGTTIRSQFVTTAENMGHSFDRGYTCTEYGLYEKEIIFNLKYKRKTHLAPIIAEIMYDRLKLQV